MATSKSQEREAREARERLKRFNARQTVHATQVKRRKRDNLFAILGVIIVAALAATVQIFYFTAGPGTPTPEPTPSAEATAPPEGQNVGNVPSPALAENRDWIGTLVLNETRLAISLDGAAAPQAVASFVQDVKSGYYTGKSCHRLENSEGIQLIQCGSEDGTGAPSDDYSYGPIENAPEDALYKTGTIGIARGATEYSQGHQFFITFGDSALGQVGQPGYTVIGTVTAGLPNLVADIADAGIEVNEAGQNAPKVPTTITSVTVK